MARVFITGSSEGLGLMAGQLLAEWGHRVTLHARNEARAADARRALPQAETVVVGNVSVIAQMRRVAEQVNALGPHDAVIHNVGVGYREPRRVETTDGLSHLFAINVLAPYLLTALIDPPKRLVYLSSGMHSGGDSGFNDPQWEKRRWSGAQAYSDSSFSTWCWHLPSPASGRTSCRTRWSPDGWRRKWAVPALPTTFRSRRSPRPGWP
jgi:NAD(P)-dependent dehydrogenase (short-subunit alcohol dehydrogenase family)